MHIESQILDWFGGKSKVIPWQSDHPALPVYISIYIISFPTVTVAEVPAVV